MQRSQLVRGALRSERVRSQAALLTPSRTVSLVQSPMPHRDQNLKERRGSEQHMKCVGHRASVMLAESTAVPAQSATPNASHCSHLFLPGKNWHRQQSVCTCGSGGKKQSKHSDAPILKLKSY